MLTLQYALHNLGVTQHTLPLAVLSLAGWLLLLNAHPRHCFQTPALDIFLSVSTIHLSEL